MANPDVAWLRTTPHRYLVDWHPTETLAEHPQATGQRHLHYTSLLNRTFSRIFVAFSSLAILAWSIAILREQLLTSALAGYGVVMRVGKHQPRVGRLPRKVQ